MFFLRAFAAVLWSCYGKTVTVLRTNLLSLNSGHVFTYPALVRATVPTVGAVLPTASVAKALNKQKGYKFTSPQYDRRYSVGV